MAEKRRRILGCTLNDQGSEHNAQGQCAAETEREPDSELNESRRHDEPRDLPLLCIERHANTDFLRALRHGVGGYRVDADGGENEGDGREDSEHAAEDLDGQRCWARN